MEQTTIDSYTFEWQLVEQNDKTFVQVICNGNNLLQPIPKNRDVQAYVDWYLNMLVDWWNTPEEDQI